MGQSITMDKSDYDGLMKQIEDARAGEAAMRDELQAERTKPLDERLAAVTEFALAAKDVIDYAVANLSPEFSRNWPVNALVTLAKHVAAFGPVTSRDHERSVIWTQYIESIRDFDRRWALMGQAAPVPPGDTAEPDVAAP